MAEDNTKFWLEQAKRQDEKTTEVHYVVCNSHLGGWDGGSFSSYQKAKEAARKHDSEKHGGVPNAVIT
jgi:hypothetical protein